MNNKRVAKLTEFIAHGSNVTCCTIGHRCNRIAATGGEDKKVNLWTLNKPTCILSLTGHTSPINSITFSSNEDKIVSGSTSGSLKVWDLNENRLICNLIGHKANVTCLEYHNYADYIASGSIDAQIRLWDLRRKGCIFTYKGHTNEINSLKFSPDSKWIASVSQDSLIKIWDLKAGRLLTDLKGHTASVNTLEFHPNEFLLATGSSDKTVKYWDLEKMENVCTSPPAPNAVKVIMFEPSGKCLYSASNDYLQSLSWEPSKCYDSVFCQWKQVVDITNSSNKLIAASLNQNMVSFYAVDLMQVQPLGSCSSSQSENESKFNEISAYNTPTISNVPNVARSTLSSTRRNFQNSQKIEASEQPDENQLLQQIQNDNSMYDNSQADICNEEEYNKIFRPNNEIKRPSQPVITQKSNMSPKNEPQKTSRENRKNLIPLSNDATEKKDPKEKDFFVDIKIKQPPPSSPQQPQPQIASNNSNIISNEEKLNNYELPITPVKNENNNLFNNEPSNNKIENNIKQDLISPNRDKQKPNNQFSGLDRPSVDPGFIIESGHESLMKALRNRYKNIQFIKTMWMSGNIKSALDAAVNLDDVSLMADILNQMNFTINAWNLDICTILLPSIKNLISSKYEEHMQIGSESCKIIFKNFGKLIKSSLSNQNIGVDITREERQRKCSSCYTYLSDIVSVIDKKMHTIVSSKLLNNFREINLLMKTLE